MFRSRPQLQSEHRNKASHNTLAGGGPCLQFVKKPTTPVKHIKVKLNKMRYPYSDQERVVLNH